MSEITDEHTKLRNIIRRYRGEEDCSGDDCPEETVSQLADPRHYEQGSKELRRGVLSTLATLIGGVGLEL